MANRLITAIRGTIDLMKWQTAAGKELRAYFRMLDGYTPAFSSFTGGVYEMELTRACIHSFAKHVSKLQPNVVGADARGLSSILERQPNPLQTTSRFLYRAATLYETKNTLIILPILDKFDRTVGFYPAPYELVEIMDYQGEPWIRLTFADSSHVAFELRRVGIVSKFVNSSDIIGDDNSALQTTLDLLHMQNQGFQEGIEHSASFRFMAQTANMTKAADLKKERERFVKDNLGPDSGGFLLFPTTYTNIQQINSAAQVVDPEQVKLIQDRVFQYFGSNDKILTNQAYGDEWAAYYEGEIEPFALQLSQAMTSMTYSQNELSRTNEIVWSSSRLQYMSASDKLQVSTQLFDRGVLTTNDVMDIWNLPHVEDGDKRYIRKEYTEVNRLDAATTTNQKEDDNDADPE